MISSGEGEPRITHPLEQVAASSLSEHRDRFTWPTISVIIPTLNCAEALAICLHSIASQDYPKESVEIIVVDGGSSDNTLSIARSFGCRVVSEPRLRHDQEARRSLGLRESVGELVAFIDSDNILPHEMLLRKLVRPFLDSRDTHATETIWYGYLRTLPALTRYFALVGAIDPVVISLGKADRLPFGETRWSTGSLIETNSDYYRVRFRPNNLPTVGANGYIAKRNILLQLVSSEVGFFHIDVNLDMVRAGYDTFAFVKDSIIHNTGQSLRHFLRRRVVYASQFLFRQYDRRRYKIYDPQFDRAKLLKHVLLSFTVIQPSIRAIKGYKTLPDKAWFFHPVVSLLLTATYCVCSSSWVLGGRSVD